MNIYDPDEFEAEQHNRLLNRAAQLETELVIANQKIQALRKFMAEARSHEGDLEDWVVLAV